MDFSKLDLTKYYMRLENSGLLGNNEIELDDIDRIEENTIFLKKSREYVADCTDMYGTFVACSNEFVISFEDRDYGTYVLLKEK